MYDLSVDSHVKRAAFFDSNITRSSSISTFDIVSIRGIVRSRDLKQKPRVFIASSAEQISVAHALQTNLQKDTEPTVWDQGVFKLSSTAVESLVNQLDRSDASIFVFGPDDVTKIRSRKHSSVRDNVVFELGLFIGRLGRHRCFIVVPNNTRDLRIPSDLIGMTYADYDADRSDKNLVAALRPACNQIVSQLRDDGDATEREKDSVVAFESFQSTAIPWPDLFSKSTHVDLLFIGSSTWRNYHFARLNTLLAQPKSRLRVLIPDPDDESMVAAITDRMGGKEEDTRKYLMDALTFFEGLATGGTSGSVELHRMTQTPLFSLFRFDDQALVAFYSHSRQLTNVPTILSTRGDIVFEFAMNEFEVVFSR
jgi:hypothetical protein